MKLKFILRISVFASILFSLSNQLSAQGIKGNITDSNGNSLPFATIYIHNIETGTTTNNQGYFEYNLPPEKYNLIFQYLGYKSVIKSVEVTSEFVTINIQLEPHTFMLKNIVVNAGKEDPAYSIMRKAIAKSKYHLQQLDSYTMQVYIKGSGRLINSPFFLRKKIAKEGIDSTTAFVSESIRKIKYTRPNTYEERVISIRSNGDDNNTSPSDFIKGSFYNPKIANTISPLSPRSFAYYKFEYLGTFKDRDYEVNKIRVIPRSKGDDIFAGEIFIVEEYWNIHSLDMKTNHLGIEIKISQIYNPIENKVWMPINHKFDIHGTFLGFRFEYNYLATISQYEIKLNKNLIKDIVIIDEKVNKELATKLRKQNKNLSEKIISKMNSGQELTRKNFRKLMRNYENLEKEKDSIPNIAYITSVKIDSLAQNQDSTFWTAQRPIPLSDYEIRGYRKIDSIAIVNKQKSEGDTIKTKKGKEGFRLSDILLGNTYKLGSKIHLELKTLLFNINFNTVEGYNFFYKIKFTKTFENKHWLEIAPKIRYAFSRNKISGLIQTTYQFKETEKKKSIIVTVGKYVNQINSSNPIVPIINTYTTLLYEYNYMKLYEKKFISLQFKNKISEKYQYSLKTEYVNRLPLQNNTNHIWIDNPNRNYTSNIPINTKSRNTAFIKNKAFLTEFNFSFKPWLKFYIQDKVKKSIHKSSPEFNMKYRNALPIRNAQISYHNIEVSVKHRIDAGIHGTLNFLITGGGYLSDDKIIFIDFKHFEGNKTHIQLTDVVASYRLLPYYEFSTHGNYVNILTHYQFRKFFLSRFKFIQKQGIKESIFADYLGTNSSNHYSELGYSIENIFRLFRVEGVASFQNGIYQDWGIRIGIASKLDEFFSIN